MPLTRLVPAAVRVPGSTSNLGAGFDTLGLAVDRALEVRYRPGRGRLEVVRSGTLADAEPAHDLVVAAFRAALGQGTDAGGRLEAHSTIPVARGLGSSAAARVAGRLLARAALGREADRRALFVEAAEDEGHPDNAAPSVYGGLTLVVPAADGSPRVARPPLSPAVAFVFGDPGHPLETARARAVLADEVGLNVAARTGARVGALLHGLATADGSLIEAGLHDELHVPRRWGLVEDADAASRAALEAGAWGVTLSGSGSGLLAVTHRDRARAVADAMASELRGGADVLRPEFLGARRLT